MLSGGIEQVLFKDGHEMETMLSRLQRNTHTHTHTHTQETLLSRLQRQHSEKYPL